MIEKTFTSIFDNLDKHHILDLAKNGARLSILTGVLTFAFELISLPTIFALFNEKGGKLLYQQAILVNLRNHFLVGIPIYTLVVPLFCQKISLRTNGHFLFFSMLRVMEIVLVHSLLYYAVHKAFHTYPSLYGYHKFHHRFNTYVPPVAANAVSFVEYLVAYIIPFAVATAIISPFEEELQVAVIIVSLSNLLVHTPRLESISKDLWPIFVSTHNHIEHHRKQTVNYAAPTINVDWILKKIHASTPSKTKF
jgi:sterol desaturase/sphingolipid hydroxylase (fatty acid hydroxylase superfamily)